MTCTCTHTHTQLCSLVDFVKWNGHAVFSYSPNHLHSCPFIFSLFLSKAIAATLKMPFSSKSHAIAATSLLIIVVPCTDWFDMIIMFYHVFKFEFWVRPPKCHWHVNKQPKLLKLDIYFVIFN